MRIIRVLVICSIIFGIGLYGVNTTFNNYAAEATIEQQYSVAVNKNSDVDNQQVNTETRALSGTLYKVPDDVNDIQVDFDALKQINPDVVAYIYIPAVDIQYPVVQGKDNQEYLKKAFDGTKNRAGSVFVNATNKADFSDDNTFIFAHNMSNGSMFGKLKSFIWDTDLVEQNPYIWIFTENGISQYEIFALYNTTKESNMYTLTNDREQYIQNALEQSVITRDCETDGKLITLSTCAGISGSGNRLLVHASLIQTY